MEIRNIKNLSNGDEIFWNDPDNGICSKHITIQNIRIVGEILCITGIDGIYLECFARELS